MNLSNLIAVVILVMGGLMATGSINSASAEAPCIANDKLLDIIKDQQKKLSDLLVESKREADVLRKKYEDKLDELRNKPCVK